METPAEREARIRRLEQARATRRGESYAETLSPAGAVEIAPGRGDMRNPVYGGYGGGSFWPTYPTHLALIGNKVASYAELFATQNWIATAVMRMLTWSVRVPLKAYRKTGEDNSRVRLGEKDHPLAAAILTPNDRRAQAQLVMDMLGPVLIHGNSVTEVEQGARNRIRFTGRDWRFSRPMMPFRDSIEGFEFDIDSPSLKRAVSVDNVIHVAWWSPFGPIGVSPLQQLGVSLSIEDAAQRYQQALFRNGARPPSAVTTSEEFLGLEPEERQQIMAQLRRDLVELYAGPDNSGRPALLPPGLDWKPVGHSAVEAALIDQRKITREEVAAVYMIPPPMLGILDHATYSNIETQREMTYTDCLGPPLVLIEQMINAQLVRTLLGETDIYVEFDFGGVLRGNKLDEIQSLREAISSALLTPNEGRDIQNMPRSDNPAMDEFYLPVNNLGVVGSPPKGPPNPTPFPPTRRQQQQQQQPQPNDQQQARTIHVRSRQADYAYDPMESAPA